MPIHDWTRVDDGTFHDFHTAWIAELRRTLNRGVLPPAYYALAEQRVESAGPDVLTLEAAEPDGDENGGGGGTAVASSVLTVADAPPKVRLTETLLDEDYALAKQRRIAVRRANSDRVVAFIEIVSPGNKDRAASVESFVGKAAKALKRGIHLLVLDLFPPGKHDPAGLHGELCRHVEHGPLRYEQPADRPLTLAAYSAGTVKTAYVEPTAVGERLIDMPLFLEPERYVPVPLEATYAAAYEGVPRRWRRVIEGEAS